jgi:hypothetical protein
MNCAECQEKLVEKLEGLLEAKALHLCQQHLDTCAECQAEADAIAQLHGRLLARGQATAALAMVNPVMRRVHQLQVEPEKVNVMSQLIRRWRFGWSATAVAAVLVMAFLLVTTRGRATAAEVLAKGAKAVAKLTSIHLRCQLRTLPADNFGTIAPEQDFVPVELWKQVGTDLKWRVEKPGRVAVMDGQSSVLYIKPGNTALKGGPSQSAFDTDWLHKIADLSNTITDELNNAVAKGWKLSLAEEHAANGAAKSIVTVEANSGLPDNDYLKNKFYDNSDTRRVYRFDSQTEMLESVQVYLCGTDGDVLIFSIDQIDYNQPIDPAVFQLQLPASIGWYREPQKEVGDEKYAAMTPEEAARAFFEACGREDWTEFAKYWPLPIDDGLKRGFGGIQIISLGQSFTSLVSSAHFVPYEIKFRDGTVKKWNLALKKDKRTGRWNFDGGL